jgi:hypothetical protein
VYDLHVGDKVTRVKSLDEVREIVETELIDDMCEWCISGWRIEAVDGLDGAYMIYKVYVHTFAHNDDGKWVEVAQFTDVEE